MSAKPKFIMVGGFLGAGKTTLLFETTRILMDEGKRVGLVTNDQASELVDTALLLQTHTKVAEVSGSGYLPLTICTGGGQGATHRDHQGVNR